MLGKLDEEADELECSSVLPEFTLKGDRIGMVLGGQMKPVGSRLCLGFRPLFDRELAGWGHEESLFSHTYTVHICIVSTRTGSKTVAVQSVLQV